MKPCDPHSENKSSELSISFVSCCESVWLCVAVCSTRRSRILPAVYVAVHVRPYIRLSVCGLKNTTRNFQLWKSLNLSLMPLYDLHKQTSPSVRRPATSVKLLCLIQNAKWFECQTSWPTVHHVSQCRITLAAQIRFLVNDLDSAFCNYPGSHP